MANTVWISFRLKDNGTYSERYNDLHNAIMSVADKWWVETSSYYIIETNYSAAQIAATVKENIAPSVDLALVGRFHYKTLYVIGANEDNDIYDLVDFAKKL